MSLPGKRTSRKVSKWIQKKYISNLHSIFLCLKFTFHFEFWGQPSLIWLLTFPMVISNTPYFDSTAKQYFLLETNETHCIEGVCIRRFCGPCFPTFGLNTDGFSVNLCIYYKYLKIRTIKAPNINRFYRAKVNISLKLLID